MFLLIAVTVAVCYAYANLSYLLVVTLKQEPDFLVLKQNSPMDSYQCVRCALIHKSPKLDT